MIVRGKRYKYLGFDKNILDLQASNITSVIDNMLGGVFPHMQGYSSLEVLFN